MLTHRQVRNKIISFWEKQNHKETPQISLVPQGDSTTLFTGSGMQPLVPYLLGEIHPLGTRIFNIQRCLRAMDIEEIGDNRHTTSFEMFGNWSLGDYFKKEQLRYFFTLLTDPNEGIGLDPHKLYVSIFEGNKDIPKDTESIEIWKLLFQEKGIVAKEGERIFSYDVKKNWWSRAGAPENMPIGEPGGPDSEVFFDFGIEHKFHENSQYKNEKCHPNCDCGRFVEIGNNVFMQYIKISADKFKELPQKNVDFGGGFERLIASVNNMPDIFLTDLYIDIIKTIEKSTNKSYSDPRYQASMRIITDHIKASVFLIYDGVIPSNKEQGYVLRRLLRRASVKMKFLSGSMDGLIEIGNGVLKTYEGIYFDIEKDGPHIKQIIADEIARFSKSLDHGLKIIEKMDSIDGKSAFDLYQSYGFPFELTEELFKEKNIIISKNDFEIEFNKHKSLSKTTSSGMFKGGLADNSEQTTKYHTATHLLHQALYDILGNEVRQEGSNITGERLRFDFKTNIKPTQDQLKEIESVINSKISLALPVTFKLLPKEEAEKINAKSFFKEKYPDTVKVYYIGNDINNAYSKEFCGGPHVSNTKDIGSLTIKKFEKIGSNLFRIYAQ
ncbi:MAG: alanine--tRNA ligase [Candidatus Roizmanbacteria bacterium]